MANCATLVADLHPPSEVQAVISSPSVVDLKARLHWLMALRIVVVTALFGLSLTFPVDEGERVPTFYALIAFTYGITIPYALILRHLSSERALESFTWIQVGIDFILETILVARTGGIESPFAVLYVITVTVSSLVPRRPAGLVAPSLCLILFGLITNLQLYQVLEPFGWLPPSRLSPAETFQTFGAYGLAFLVVGLLSGVLADQLRKADLSIQEKEEGLSRLQLFHENIIRSISSGVFTADAAGRITSFNPAAQEATGYSLEQIKGRPWREVFNWHPQDAADGAAAAFSAPSRFEVECKRADGSRLVLGMTVSPLHEQGRQTGLVGVFKDLTKIRDLEAEMRRREWLATLGEMAAGMAHEIRNPLGALAGAMQMLRKDASSDETNQRLMDIAVREATRLDGIITAFLQYARPPALSLAEQDLNGVLTEVLNLVQHHARSQPTVTVVASLASTPLRAQVDQDQLKQVFWNLATNALQAMPNGGRLTILTACRSVEAGGRRGDVIEVAFEDTGEGIPRENLGKIFLPFFTTKKQGSGLGLATVHRIVDLHGGWIKVDSEVGKGSRFVVCLPRSADMGLRPWHEGREPWKKSS